LNCHDRELGTHAERVHPDEEQEDEREEDHGMGLRRRKERRGQRRDSPVSSGP
jgi:hypothetical protein